MYRLTTRTKLLIPFIVALVLCTQSTAWALGQQCIGCDTPPPALFAVRNHIPAASLLDTVPPAPVPARAVSRPPVAALRAPTRLPAVAAPVSTGTGLVQHCAASDYGYDYQGVAMSAASKEIPHGRHARVTAPNGRSVVVLINDSGPYISGRCIDLSLSAKHALGYPSGVIDNVTVEELA